MLTFPTKNLFIEGSDCAGKSTLIRTIHRKTSYRWHIHDRSQISRKIFAKMYSRNSLYIESDFHLEISDLNNRFIFLVPDVDIVQKRFLERGDEIHDMTSLMDVWSKFSEESDRLLGYPNVIIVHDGESERISDIVIPHLHLMERTSLRLVSDQVRQFVGETKSLESYPLQFTLFDDGDFEEATKESMNYEPEREYYKKIYRLLHDKISREIAGNNEYGRKEDFSSRRFVYSSDSCISFIHVSCRSEVMDFHVVIRSSDVENTFSHDLKFLYYLASTCFSRLRDNCNSARMRFNLNSAHYVR